ncbi:FtsX-like permease family protein [Bacillus toyonensis]|uniref:FtsX-like permease family protein n=1 Tax=Bacillus toyonensis TaxID=155322 RepID=UPI003D261BA8
MSSTFAVIFYFTYSVLVFHPYFSREAFVPVYDLASNESIRTGFELAKTLILFFSFLFILYSVTSFYKIRKREFGILMTYGMSNFQLKKLIYIENMLIGICSILLGIGIGLIVAKIGLLASSFIMGIKELMFYFPIKAICSTSIVFSILFIFISFFTTRIVKGSQPIELSNSGEQPKTEPKSFVWLALLAIIFICASYVLAFYLKIAAIKGFTYGYAMVMCIFFIGTLGTYFLFTQLGFYIIKSIKNQGEIFFKKTNLLTISELAYRMTDNTKALFLISILSATSFTAIGTCLGMNDATQEYQSSYAFSYKSFKGNVNEASHIQQIKKQLDASKFSYTLISPITIKKDLNVIKLSDYNKCMTALGSPVETLRDELESFILPSNLALKLESKDKLKRRFNKINIKNDNISLEISGKKILFNNALKPVEGSIAVVADSVYDQIKYTTTLQVTSNYPIQYEFFIKNWQETSPVSQKIMNAIPYTFNEAKPTKQYSFTSKALFMMEWKRTNGNRLIMSVMVGSVFFAYAMSFLYFRLFTDLERDKKQYQILSQIGLTTKELEKIVSLQIGILCFIPFGVAVIHSIVSLLAIKKLQLDFNYPPISVVKAPIIVFATYFCIQIAYFFIIRRIYLRRISQYNE